MKFLTLLFIFLPNLLFSQVCRFETNFQIRLDENVTIYHQIYTIEIDYCEFWIITPDSDTIRYQLQKDWIPSEDESDSGYYSIEPHRVVAFDVVEQWFYMEDQTTKLQYYYEIPEIFTIKFK